MWPVYVAVGMLGLWLSWKLLVLALGRYERLFMKGDLQPVPSTTELPRYLQVVSEHLEQAGFRPGGRFQVVRDGAPKEVYVGLWCSPDGRTLAEVEGGWFMGTPVRRTKLQTRVEGGGIIESQDEVAMGDPTGMCERDFLLSASVDELLAFHARRIGERHVGPPFDVGRQLEQRDELEEARARRAHGLGLGTIHASGTTWNWTWRGSWRLQASSRPLRARAFAQRERVNLTRPGSET